MVSNLCLYFFLQLFQFQYVLYVLQYLCHFLLLLVTFLYFHVFCNVFLDPPGKPGKPTIEDWDNKSVDLKWSPAAENGAPITSYIIEAKCGVAGSWEDVFESDVSNF